MMHPDCFASGLMFAFIARLLSMQFAFFVLYSSAILLVLTLLLHYIPEAMGYRTAGFGMYEAMFLGGCVGYAGTLVSAQTAAFAVMAMLPGLLHAAAAVLPGLLHAAWRWPFCINEQCHVAPTFVCQDFSLLFVQTRRVVVMAPRQQIKRIREPSWLVVITHWLSIWVFVILVFGTAIMFLVNVMADPFSSDLCVPGEQIRGGANESWVHAMFYVAIIDGVCQSPHIAHVASEDLEMYSDCTVPISSHHTGLISILMVLCIAALQVRTMRVEDAWETAVADCDKAAYPAPSLNRLTYTHITEDEDRDKTQAIIRWLKRIDTKLQDARYSARPVDRRWCLQAVPIVVGTLLTVVSFNEYADRAACDVLVRNASQTEVMCRLPCRGDANAAGAMYLLVTAAAGILFAANWIMHASWWAVGSQDLRPHVACVLDRQPSDPRVVAVADVVGASSSDAYVKQIINWLDQ